MLAIETRPLGGPTPRRHRQPKGGAGVGNRGRTVTAGAGGRIQAPGMAVRPLSLLWYGGALGVLAAALPAQLALRLVTAPFDRDRRASGRFLRAVGSTLVRIFPPWHVEIEGELPAGPFVLVANHRSWLDVLVLSRLPREMKWVAKEELFRVPWLGWMLRLSGDIPVRRGDGPSSEAALESARAYLARGLPVVFFPEGTRSRDGALRAFKLGAFQVAEEAGVPIVPVALSGTAEGMPADTLALRPAHIVARILAPVQAGAGGSAALRDVVRARIAEALPSAASDARDLPRRRSDPRPVASRARSGRSAARGQP
jgi:1-acyl-sn-glycerol-3-phosphate acyltransferase